MEKGRPVGNTRFFRWLAGRCDPITGSLEQLTGERIDGHDTPLIESAGMAWAVPVDRLSCEQVNLLTEQKMGLQWLAAPVAIFVRTYPGAFVTFFEGDLTLSALRAFAQFMEFAPVEARAMLAVDFSSIVAKLEKADPPSGKEFQIAVTEARVLARGHS